MQNHPVDRHRGLSAGVLAGGMLSLAASLMMFSGPAQAQAYDPRYPVCITVYGPFGGETIDCRYETLQQCRATASGRSASCDVNPYFIAPPEAPPRPYRRHRYIR